MCAIKLRFSNTNAPMLVKLHAMGISFSHNYYKNTCISILSEVDNKALFIKLQ